MNAYELATALRVESSQMEYGYVVDNWELLDNAAKMLRQQADRIAELEKQTKPLSEDEIWEIWEKFNGEIKNFAKAIEERHGIK